MAKTIKVHKLNSIKYALTVTAVVFFGYMLISDYEASGTSISHSLDICAKTLIPSLFPFMFLSAFITRSGILEKNIIFLDKITYKLSGLPFCSAVVFIMSIIGGYPIGPRMIKELYLRGSVTENQANRMMLFCINPSPAFVINTIGFTMFSSKKIGVIIYFSTVLSNILLSIFTKFLDDKKKAEVSFGEKCGIGKALTQAADDATSGIIKICSYVILFSALISIISSITENRSVLDFLYGFCEVTLGCERLSRLCNITLIAGVTAWGGIAVHFQIADCISQTHTNLYHFFTSRVVSGALSVIICDIFLKQFPIDVSALSQSTEMVIVPNEASLPVSITLLITCFFFLIGDYTVNNHIRNIKQQRNYVETSKKM